MKALFFSHNHRRRSDWNSGGTHGERRMWVGAKWGGYGEGSPPRLLGSLGKCRELPQRGPGQSLGRKRIMVYFEATERSFFLHI